MAFYLFRFNSNRTSEYWGEELVTASSAARLGFWPISPGAPNSKRLRGGDQALILETPTRLFRGRVTVGGIPRNRARKSRRYLGDFPEPTRRLLEAPLSDAVVWKRPLDAAEFDIPPRAQGIGEISGELFFSVVRRAEDDPANWEPWVPRPLVGRADPVAQTAWSYVVVEEVLAETFRAVVAPWPSVDPAGALRWTTGDARGEDEDDIGIEALVPTEWLSEEVSFRPLPGAVLAFQTSPSMLAHFLDERRAGIQELSGLGALEGGVFDVTTEALSSLAAVVYAAERVTQSAGTEDPEARSRRYV